MMKITTTTMNECNVTNEVDECGVVIASELVATHAVP